MLDCSKTIGKSSKKRKEKGFFNMYKIQLNDRAKENKIAVYYMEDASKLYDLWKDKEESEERIECLRYALRGEKMADIGLSYEEAPLISEVELKVGAKQDFSMERSWLVLHNTKGYESKYYVGNLLAKIRWAVCEEKFLKLGSFVATGICKENTYDEGGFEQITCCGNPVLSHYSSSVAPLVSDFEDEFSREKITMLGYKVLAEFVTMEEVNADIAKKRLTDAEVEVLLHDIPGELG